MDFDRAAWFMAGLVIGNLLDTFTTVVLLTIWLVARNQALPICLGGYYPQDLLASFFHFLNIWVGLVLPSKLRSNKGNKDESSVDLGKVKIEELPDQPSKGLKMLEGSPTIQLTELSSSVNSIATEIELIVTS